MRAPEHQDVAVAVTAYRTRESVGNSCGHTRGEDHFGRGECVESADRVGSRCPWVLHLTCDRPTPLTNSR